MVSPARISVANWRVTSASPLRESRGREKRSRFPVCAAVERVIPSTASGERPRSRSSDLAWRSVSASITPRVWRPVASSALYSKPDMPGADSYSRPIRDSFSRNAQHFLEAGLARAHPAQAVLAQALHASAARVLAQVGLGGAIVDQPPGLVVYEEQLENPGAALITRERAGLASARGEQGGVRPAPVAVLEQGLLGAVGLVRAPARRAQPPHQPLGEHAKQARGDQERLHAHLHEPHHRARLLAGLARGRTGGVESGGGGGGVVSVMPGPVRSSLPA